MEFLLVLIIDVLLPCRISSRTFWGPVKKGGALSTDFSDQWCTQFMMVPSLGTLMTIPIILIWYKYSNIYMLLTDVNVSLVPNIGHRTQHPRMQMLLPWMSPAVSLTMMVIPWFGLVGDFFVLCLFTSDFPLYILLLDTQYSLHIELLLVMTHIYMMTILTVSLTTLMFSVALRSLTSQRHSLQEKL